jgi:capsular polysaccharide transport system permease protein
VVQARANYSRELQTRLQLSETLTSAPSSPSIQSLEVRIASLEEQIASESAKIVGGNDALATRVAEFERLSLARGFAEKNLAGAFAALELARQQGQRMHLYIETVVAPNHSDESTEPRATRLIACVFLVTFVLFCLLWLVITGSKEHQHG